MTNKIKYSTLGFLFGSILFLSVSAFAANGSWSIGNGFMTFKQQGESANVNVGIGIEDPDQKLVVNGKIKSISTDSAESDGQVVTTVDYIQNKLSGIQQGQWKILGGNIYRDSGNVGIHVQNPTQKLEVGGSARILDSLQLGAADNISGEITNSSQGIFLKATDQKNVAILNAQSEGLTIDTDGNGVFDNNTEVKGVFSFHQIDWISNRNINLKDSGEYSFDFSENTGASTFNIWAPGKGSLFSLASDGEITLSDSLTIGGDALITGKAYSAQTEESDPDNTLITKKYFDENGGIVSGAITCPENTVLTGIDSTGIPNCVPSYVFSWEGEWSEWSTDVGMATRTRSLTCVRNDGETAIDQMCGVNKPDETESERRGGPTDGWNDWNQGVCSTDCGTGTKTNTRTCIFTEGTDDYAEHCTGENTEISSCTEGSNSCGLSNWSYGSCSKTCGGGTKSGTRYCTKEGDDATNHCVGSLVTSSSCNTQNCCYTQTTYSYGWSLVSNVTRTTQSGQYKTSSYIYSRSCSNAPLEVGHSNSCGASTEGSRKSTESYYGPTINAEDGRNSDGEDLYGYVCSANLKEWQCKKYTSTQTVCN